ncbi:hypothetical protein Nepgr_011048 [Nepenthes gracilis]|uniref:RRM domain-containing protein n=1 Tax=Nepenthes gracilis TaxID=150966 RepID=A0AAD3XLL2_NEPGR|nr:hypothetical protein Nepgr_011048 [Nepenthes gracilis]
MATEREHSDNPSDDHPNKRKRDAKQTEDFHHSQNPSTRKKSKSINADVEQPDFENAGLKFDRGINKSGSQSNADWDNARGDMNAKKKKRKRDEIEREYGAAAVEEEEKEGKTKEKSVGVKRKTIDNPDEMVISKDGYDEETKLSRTVFVGNLPLKVNKKELLNEFGQFGEIESVGIRSMPTIDESKKHTKVENIKDEFNEACGGVHAFIVFKTDQSAASSLAHNMAVVRGNHIRVDMGCPPGKKLKGDTVQLYDNKQTNKKGDDAPGFDYKRTVFVGNLPLDVKDEELYLLFSGIKNLESNAESVRVIRDPLTSLRKGSVYILFKTAEDANLVVRMKNVKLRDHKKFPVKRSRIVDSSSSSRKQKRKADAFNQGFPERNSGVKKKSPPNAIDPVILNSVNRMKEGITQGMNKRPTVTDRKNKAKLLKAEVYPRKLERSAQCPARMYFALYCCMTYSATQHSVII